MATVSRGEITITNVADGKPSYTHWAYAWSADGTDRFTPVYPRENLIINSGNFKTLAPWSGGVLDTTTFPFPTLKGTGSLAQPENLTLKSDTEYVAIMRAYFTAEVEISSNFPFHTYIREEGGIPQSGRTYMEIVGGNRKAIPNTWETIIIKFKTIASDKKITFKPHLYHNAWNGAERWLQNVMLVESREIPDFWIPNPADDFANAYPTYAGTYTDDQQTASNDPADYTWQRILGQGGGDGKDGESAPLISLSGATQAITVDKDGKITPASSFSVTGTAVNTAISNWTYSLNGGNFGSAVPTGVTRSGNTVTINPVTATFNQLTIKAADATVSDVFTISRIKDGGEGPPGADAYTVFLTNESYTFAGSTSAALAGSTTTEAVVYKGINKITPTSITVGTRPTGLTSSVSGSVVTFTAATSLVTKSGTVPITIVADGKTFTKQFAYALSLQGGKGDPGENGVSVTGTQVQYVQTSSMTEPTSGWSTTRPTPVPGQWLWTRSRNILSNGTYGAWATVPTLIGREAIVVSATAPSNPTTGTLWQTPADPNVQKWDGTKWVDWGIAAENILADNLVVNDGKFEKLIGTEIEGGIITNPFDYWDGESVPGGTDEMWRRGQTTINKSEVVTIWEDYNKSTGAKIKEGGVIQNSNGSSVFVNDPSGYSQRSSVRMDGILIADSRGVGGATSTFLTYSDLVKIQPIQLTPATGWSVYATSGSNRPIGSRTGRIVTLSGAFKNNSVLSNSNDVITIGSVPNALRPLSEVKIIVKGAGTSSYMLIVDTDGLIKIQYRLGWTGSQYGYIQNNSGDIFNIHVTYPGVDIF